MGNSKMEGIELANKEEEVYTEEVTAE